MKTLREIGFPGPLNVERECESQEERVHDIREGVKLLNQIVENDASDFQAWTLLGTLYLAEEKREDAEKAYGKAIEIKFFIG